MISHGERLRAHGARHARWYDATRWLFLHGRRRVVRALGVGRGSTVVDAGCGTGHGLARLARRVRPGGRVVGVDPSPAMLARARRRGLAGVDLVEGDFAEVALPVAEGTVDAVVFSYSLSMSANPGALLDRATALLRPGGRLGVVDFLETRGVVGRWWFGRFPVRVEPELREGVRGRLQEVEREWTARSPWLLWRWFALVGIPP